MTDSTTSKPTNTADKQNEESIASSQNLNISQEVYKTADIIEKAAQLAIVSIFTIFISQDSKFPFQY